MSANTTTGAQTIWTFLWEDELEYAQEPGEPDDDDFKPFGDREEITEPDSDNNQESLFRPFNRLPSTYLEGEFQGSWGVDFVYTNPYWLKFIFGNPDVTENGDDTFTLDFEINADTVPASAHVIEETHYGDGTVEQNVYAGAVVEGPDISIQVGDPIEISIDGDFATEYNYDDANESPYGVIDEQPQTNFRPLHFGNADLFLDVDEDGTAERQGRVQSLDLNFNGTVEIENELGTRVGTIPSFLELEPDISYSKFLSADTKEQERRSFYGSLEDEEGEDYATVQESLCGSDIAGRVEVESSCDETNEARFLFAEAIPDSYQRTNTGDVQSAIEEDVDRSVTDLNVVATIDEDPRV